MQRRKSRRARLYEPGTLIIPFYADGASIRGRAGNFMDIRGQPRRLDDSFAKRYFNDTLSFMCIINLNGYLNHNIKFKPY